MVRVPSRARSVRSGLLRALALVVAAALLAGCSLFPEKQPAQPSPTDAGNTSETVPFGSEFSRDGTYQSHIVVDGVDFVWSVWASKATPRMQEWRPGGSKYFSFTFQAYDTRRRMRDPFRTKRKIWLQRMVITSDSSNPGGPSESPYQLDKFAPDVTFDPEAVTNGRLGMLITSPKGAFELRNQVIGDLAQGTEGVTLRFEAIVHVQNRAGVRKHSRTRVNMELPIAIFASDQPTRPQPVPYNAS